MLHITKYSHLTEGKATYLSTVIRQHIHVFSMSGFEGRGGIFWFESFLKLLVSQNVSNLTLTHVGLNAKFLQILNSLNMTFYNCFMISRVTVNYEKYMSLNISESINKTDRKINCAKH